MIKGWIILERSVDYDDESYFLGSDGGYPNPQKVFTDYKEALQAVSEVEFYAWRNNPELIGSLIYQGSFDDDVMEDLSKIFPGKELDYTFSVEGLTDVELKLLIETTGITICKLVEVEVEV